MIEAKKSLNGVPPYVPGTPIDEIKRRYGLAHVVKLASNENPLGASPKAKEAARLALEEMAMYPDPGAYELRQALAAHIGILPEQFIFGTGSDGLIELVCKTFLAEGDESIMPDPSFSLYELNVLAAGATPVKVPTNKDYTYSPLSFLPYINEKTKVIWLCNPNNPTGSMYTESEQLAFLSKVPDDVLVVIDEAYYEFAKDNEAFPNSLSQLESHKNILILRTFSKIYGLASLRVGYGIADPALISELEKARPPFNVCAPAQKGAIAALSDKAFVENTLEENRSNKAYLEKEFARLGLSYVKSATNFIAVCVNRDAKEVYEKLLQKGYIVKGGHILSMPGYLRVTIGTKEECEGFIGALETVLEEL